MKIKKFNIPIFDWRIIFIEVEKAIDYKVVEKSMRKIDCSSKDIEEIKKEIIEEIEDGAWTFTNKDLQTSLIIIYPASKSTRLNSICHEKRHTEDRLMDHLGINDIETAGYIAGYLGEKLLN